MHIERISIRKIKLAAYNPRKELKVGSPAYERLKKSIDTFGSVEPLVWNKRSGNLVSGHQRLKILKARGDRAVDVSVVDLDDEREKLLNLTLNQHAGEWDNAQLADLLRDLAGIDGIDLDLSGFAPADLDKLVSWTPAPETALPAPETHDARPKSLRIETVDVNDLKPHPRNYLVHPPDQLAHLVASIRENGYYRNIVIARENTILAGHGIHEAVRSMGWKTVPVIRLDLDPSEPRALKVLTGDNGTRHLAEVDDRLLSELLKEIRGVSVEGLLGTGFDAMMLANLIYVTRAETEIAGMNEAQEWVGLPSFDEPGITWIKLNFRCDEDRQEAARRLGVRFKKQSMFWPLEDKQRDVKSLTFEDEARVES